MYETLLIRILVAFAMGIFHLLLLRLDFCDLAPTLILLLQIGHKQRIVVMEGD
jgi:hypothetical protein